MTVRRWLTAVAVFVTTVLGLLALGAPTAQAATCDGVWVVVAGQGTRCATSHGTGKAALQSAGFATKDKSPGYLCQIGGSPEKCVITTDAYWSYWQATKNSDGSWGKWTYSNLGYTSTRPKRGNAEGWTFGNGRTPPPAPPKDAPKPPPAPEPTKPAPAPSTTAPKPPAAKPAAPATKDPELGKTSTKPVAPTASQQPAEPEASETSTEEATPTQTPVGQTSSAEPADSSSPSPAADPTMTPISAPAAGGSPVGTVATLAAVVLGGGGLGTWWFLKRRP